MKLFKLFFIPFALLLCLSSEALAAAACNGMQLELFPNAIDLAGNSSPTIVTRVKRQNKNKACTFFITADYGTASTFSNRHLDRSGGSATIPVQLFTNLSGTNVMKNLMDASSSSDVISGTFPQNSGPDWIDTPFYVKLDTGGYQQSGFYSQNFTIRVFVGDFNDYQQVASHTLSLTYNMQKSIDLSLVETGAAFNVYSTSRLMDFDYLTQGKVRACDLIINYNAGYRLTIGSLRLGRLKHVSQSDVINYTMTLNGSVVNLSSGIVTLPPVSGAAPSGGLRLPIQVTIGSLAGKATGTYQDIVLFSVVSSE